MHGLPVHLVEVPADVIVVGGGGAASRAALSARQAGASVRLVTKAAFKSGGSTVHGASEIMSMGAAGFGDRADSTQAHYQDTMRAGRDDAAYLHSYVMRRDGDGIALDRLEY